jgi:hypothetical protein
MAITGKLAQTLGAGVVACLVLLGPAGVAGAQLSAASGASSAARGAGRSVPAPGLSSELMGAACASSGDCWAVGLYVPSRAELSQVLHWNGRRWSQVPTPTPGLDSALSGAACASSGNCWAVGVYENSRAAFNQVLHWNGRRWSQVSTPQPGGHVSELASVRCTSAGDCWAVGDYLNTANAGLNQALHWNGRRWSLIPTPQPGGTARRDFSALGGIRCTSASDCWAVGDYGNPAGAGLNQVLHWNGRRWSLIPAPQPGGTASGDLSILSHVSCASLSSCWAVGDYSTAGSRVRNLNQVLRWNGRRWSLVATPDLGGTASGDFNTLSSIRCTSSASCWAVGFFQLNGQKPRNQVLHWNGTRWSAAG